MIVPNGESQHLHFFAFCHFDFGVNLGVNFFFSVDFPSESNSSSSKDGVKDAPKAGARIRLGVGIASSLIGVENTLEEELFSNGFCFFFVENGLSFVLEVSGVSTIDGVGEISEGSNIFQKKSEKKW